MTNTYDQLIQQGLQARQANNRQQALTLFKEAITFASDQFLAYREAGNECRDLGLFSEAESFYKEALDLNPDDFVTLILQAICNRRQGKSELCLQQLMAIVDNNIENAWLYSELAITLKELGRLTEAEHWFRRALAKEPTTVHILWQFALLARMQGNRELALTQFETIISLQPLHVQAYLEMATELQELGRQHEALLNLQLAFVQTQHPALLEKYLLMLFEQNARIACYELLLHAAYHPISVVLIDRFFSYVLICPQDSITFSAFPKHLVVTLLSQDDFSKQLGNLKVNHFDSFNALLSYFEPVLISLTTDNCQSLMNNKLFLLLVVFAWYKKNDAARDYVIEHINQYIAQFAFSDLCRVTRSLAELTDSHFVLSLFAKTATEQHSVDCLLACLIMRGYNPDESCLAAFDDKETLLKLLPSFRRPNNEATLKNIFTHLLQKGTVTLAELETLYPEPKFLASLKAVDDALKPLSQVNRPRFSKPPAKLKVALCISGQLRGYQEAFASIKKSIVDPLQPDIFVHTWKDVGFKEPMFAPQATRVFQGQFLQAYQSLFLLQNYSYHEITKLLPTLFLLLNENSAVTPQQLKDFYQTDFVVVEDDLTHPYVALSNMQKMFYKIYACNQLIQTSGKSYDLVIRLRPDREWNAIEACNWLQIAEICNNGKVIFVDSVSRLGKLGNFWEFGGGIFGIGDMLAIGSQSSMDFYANVPKFQNIYLEYGLAYFAKERQVSHSLLAHGLFLGGYVNKALPLVPGKFFNTCLGAKEILQAIRHDLANCNKEVADNLVNALEQDIIDQINY